MKPSLAIHLNFVFCLLIHQEAACAQAAGQPMPAVATGVTTTGVATTGVTTPNTAVIKLPRALAVPGGIAIIKIADAVDQINAPIAKFEGNRVWVVKQKAAWYAVVGLALSIKVGEHILDVAAQGQQEAQKIAFNVKDKKYAVQRLTITNKAMVDPPPEVLARIDNESKHLIKVRSTFTANDKTHGAFALPAAGKLSSKFGLGRILNGQARSPHAGLDLAIGVGTPVTAAADGILLDADDYYYCGKTAFIDHGNGLISMHCHLSEFIASVGTAVKRGDVIGKSGVTGRITGPHLHWSIYLNATSVDPELFLNQVIPKER